MSKLHLKAIKCYGLYTPKFDATRAKSYGASKTISKICVKRQTANRGQLFNVEGKMYKDL
jgi:hypothetical protein